MLQAIMQIKTLLQQLIQQFFKKRNRIQQQSYICNLKKQMSVSSMTVGGKIKYKIVLLGDQSTGKTAIIQRFINEKFEQNYNATIGIDFLVKNIVFQNKTYRLQLWDTAGQERFKSLIPSYLKDSNCALIIYDVNSQKSLQNASKWVELYNQHKQPAAFSVLVGNKIDIEQHSCSKQMMSKVSQQLRLQSFFISAKTGKGVSDMFYSIIEMINDKIANTKIVDEIEEKKEQEQVDQYTKHQQNKQPIKLAALEPKTKTVEVRENCC